MNVEKEEKDMKQWKKQLLTALLAVGILLSLIVPAFAMEGEAAYALKDGELVSLLNRETLHPQVTGCIELDAILEQAVKSSEGEDILTRLKIAYAWVITQIQYSWRPYSVQAAPAYEYFYPQHDLTFVEGLEEVLPRELVNRVYHALHYREGVCYEYAAAFALLVRYLGLNAYVHTGYVNFGKGDGQVILHHGYTVMELDGETLVFDPQMDMRLTRNGVISYYCFGIPEENQWRYTGPDTMENKERDVQCRRVEADRSYMPHIHVEASASGEAEGEGAYEQGRTVCLRAVPKENASFRGWYDEDGKLCSSDPAYSFQAEEPRYLRAVFNDEYFVDLDPQCWYTELATEIWKKGLMDGIGNFRFDGSGLLTRAMAVTMIYQAMEEEPDGTAEVPYMDVPADAWYLDALTWCCENHITDEVFTEAIFRPNDAVTREQFITLLVFCAKRKGLSGELVYLPYWDVHSMRLVSLNAHRLAQSWGLLNGYADGSIRPHNYLNRAEGAALLMRLLDLLDGRSMPQKEAA